MCVGEKLTAVSGTGRGGGGEFHAHARGAQRRHLDKLALTAAQLCITPPWYSVGTSITTCSMGSIVLLRPPVQQHLGGTPPARSPRAASSRSGWKDASPRPITRKDSLVGDHSTCSANPEQFLCRRSRIWRLVTNLPSLPANGLSLTGKGHLTVGSLILTKGRGFGPSACRLQGIADADVRQAAERDDIACVGGFNGSAAIGLKAVQRGDAPFLRDSLSCQSHTDTSWPTTDGAVLHTPDADNGLQKSL